MNARMKSMSGWLAGLKVVYISFQSFVPEVVAFPFGAVDKEGEKEEGEGAVLAGEVWECGRGGRRSFKLNSISWASPPSQRFRGSASVMPIMQSTSMSSYALGLPPPLSPHHAHCIVSLPLFRTPTPLLLLFARLLSKRPRNRLLRRCI